MAVTARKHVRFSAASDDSRHRRVIAGMPIRRQIEVANLSERQSRSVSRDAPGDAIIWRRFVGELNWIRPWRGWWLRRYRCRGFVFLYRGTSRCAKHDQT